jgi:hypothetical protein
MLMTGAADERLTCDHAAQCGAHFGGDRYVGMTSAEHHDRVAGGAAVGARAQSPPQAKWIDDRHACADVELRLDKAFRRVGLARAGGADDRDPVIERVGGKSCRQNTIGDRGGADCARTQRALADGARHGMCGSRWHGESPSPVGTDRVFVHDSFVVL